MTVGYEVCAKCFQMRKRAILGIQRIFFHFVDGDHIHMMLSLRVYCTCAQKRGKKTIN